MVFLASYLRRRELDPVRLLGIKVTDDALAPTLPCGLVVVDTRDRDLRSNCIYGLRVGGGLPILRLARLEENEWWMAGDNPDWPREPWPGDTEILGAAVWAAKWLGPRKGRGGVREENDSGKSD